MHILIASIITSIVILYFFGGVVGGALILFFTLIVFGMIESKHLTTSQKRERKNLFENIYLIAGAIILTALSAWYFLSENLNIKDEMMRDWMAYAFIVFLLITIRLVVGRIYKKSKKEIKAKQIKEFDDLEIQKKEIDKDEIRARGYGIEPVFAKDGSISRVELKNPQIIEGLVKDLRKKRPAAGVVIEALAERFGVEIVEDSLVKTRRRIFNSARKAIKRGEVIRLQQLLQHAEDDEEAGFILFLQNLKSKKSPPLAVPFAIYYIRSAQSARAKKKRKRDVA